MIITQRKMCRESRKIFEFLDELASKNGVQGILTPAHIYICDILVCRFFTEPMKNVINNKLQHIGKKSSKHFEITYWDSVITMMLGDKAASRNNQMQVPASMETWDILNEFVITDYSIEDALFMLRIASQYNTDQIREACNIAKKANVYNLMYINAVLERSTAEHNIVVTKIDQMAVKIEKSDALLNKPKVQHSTIDLAIAQYNFSKKLEDYKLEKKMNELTGGI